MTPNGMFKTLLPRLNNMNREQKRVYQRKIKNDRRASQCPLCGNKSLFYCDIVTTKPFNEEGGGHSGPPGDAIGIKCEVCGGTVLRDPAIANLLNLKYYVPMPLPLFELALNEEIKKRIDEENKPKEEEVTEEVTE